MTREYTFEGIVQGVGFRPIALRLAKQLDIKGEVKNSGGNVTIVAEGESKVLEDYIRRLVSIFKTKSIKFKDIEQTGYDDFRIVHSEQDNKIPHITPDLATCEQCESELHDKNNRRYNHPFISCINCGARYSIMECLPYDRENITMGEFALCDECEKEYTNHNDIRCHAQTIACNQCGPQISISIEDAVKELKSGGILAIKGIGGYHLSCITENGCAKRLRELKGRETKPFAVMFKDIEQIEEYCSIDEEERNLLLSSARPIVLLKKKKDLPSEICKNSDSIGAFLPCNPIQIMILDRISPLVMTSANISGEPIITDDEEIKKFGIKVLSHNREILTPLDDSVVQVVMGRTQFLRRARGYVPLAINIGTKASKDSLLMGGDLKSTFAIMHNEYVYPSQYFGDLENEKCYDKMKYNINHFCSLHSFVPQKIVCDKHPLYFSSRMFNPDKNIQHHLAHAYSVVAEHHIEGDVLSFVFDGTGYGDDGAVWGAEVFLNTKRVEHLDYIKMPASDEIAKDARLCLACYDGSNDFINAAIENDVNIVNYSGMGRLFDAVASALDICHYNTYEGECATALEMVAAKTDKAYYIEPSLNPKKIIEAIKQSPAPKEETALGFHHMLCNLILSIADKYGVEQIVLSGGCFVNKILCKRTIQLLEEKGYKVYINEKVPCGDQGLCLGQAYLSALWEGKNNVCCIYGKSN